ncbi:transport acessory protein MmpS [Mycobacterium hackensackense]|nr:transport acessory protein MmpS [Mycobacterium hackensackense]
MQLGAKAVAKAWIPMVIIIVILVGGSMIWQFHGVFGSDRQSGSANKTDNIVATLPKTLSYQVFGPASATGRVSYIDEYNVSQEAQFDELPWSHTFTTTAPSAYATLVVQGDSDSLGCRITVNGAVRDEVTAHGTDVMAYCLVKAA